MKKILAVIIASILSFNFVIVGSKSSSDDNSGSSYKKSTEIVCDIKQNG